MQPPELSGLVLTHGERNPSLLIEQLSRLCGQVVVVVDSIGARNDPISTLGPFPDCELTVIERDFDTFPGQRNAGIEKALGDWVLVADSDELLSPELAEEIAALEPSDAIDVYNLGRIEHLKDNELRVAHAFGSLHPRLFRSFVRYAPEPVVHERLEVAPDRVGSLRGKLQHFPEESYKALVLKALGYGREKGLCDQNQDGPEFSWFKIASTLPNFMLRRGFWRDGSKGLSMAFLQMSYRIGTRIGARKRNV